MDYWTCDNNDLAGKIFDRGDIPWSSACFPPQLSRFNCLLNRNILESKYIAPKIYFSHSTAVMAVFEGLSGVWTVIFMYLICFFSFTGATSFRPRHGHSHMLEKRGTTPMGFQLAATGTLTGVGLTSTCEQVLYQNINCNAFVSTLGQRVYHGSLQDPLLTDSVCMPTCGNALMTAHRRILGACAQSPELAPGYPVVALLDRIHTGWNETCLKDNKSMKYCNGKIFNSINLEIASQT